MMQVAYRFWLTTILIILFSGILYARQSEVDKLKVLIANEKNDTIKIKLLIRFGMVYGSAQDFYKTFMESYKLSLKHNFRQGLIYNRFVEGVAWSDNGKFDEAIDKFKSCIDGLDSLGIIQPAQYPLSWIRVLFDFAGKQEEKFRYYSDKIVYYKKHGPVENTANCFQGIAGYYMYLADYDKAIEYYMRAREVYKNFDSIGYVIEDGLIGNAYLRWGNLDKAEEYLKSGLTEAARMDLVENVIFCYNNLADLYLTRHDYKRALQSCVDLASRYPPSSEYAAINFVNRAAVYLHQNELDSARFYLAAADRIRQNDRVILVAPFGNLEIDYYYYLYFSAAGDPRHALKCLEAALDDAQSSRYLPLVLKYTNELHTYLLKRGDSIQALRYLIQYQAIQDSLNTMSTRARIATFETEQQALQNEDEIEQLKTQKTSQRNYYLISGAFLLLVVMGMISRLYYKRKRDREQLTTEFRKQLAQAETTALRAQMNPHFIFNCLNSINSFVIDQQHEVASDYLIKFSKLIRLILDNSRCEKITIEKELETLKLYILLESARFDNKFTYVCHISNDVSINSVMIPPMLLQPFIENAIWHGLMQKETAGTIALSINKEDEEFLIISITDNGIGREKAAELKSKSATHKSQGMKVTSERIEMMNKLNSTGAHVNIIDLKDEKGNAAGTRVELIIPY